MPDQYSNFTQRDSQGGTRTFNGQQWGHRGNSVDANGSPIYGTSGLEADVDRYRSMGAGGPQSGPVINQGRSDETRAMSMGSLGLLEQTARGATPSAAERLGMKQTQDAQNAQTSMGASVRGGAMARAAAGRAATFGAATAGQIGAQQGQATRAAEMEGARGAYNSAATAQRGQDLGLATSQAQLEMGQRNANEQRDQFYENLGYNTKKAGLDQALGRSAAESAATNANRAQGLAEQAQSRANTNQMVSTGVGGAQGAMQGYAKSQDPYQDPNKTLSDERTKTKVVPLSEDAGTERHWDADVSKAAPDVMSGASFSGQTPKYSSKLKGEAPAKAKAAPKKASIDLKKQGEAMLAAQQERSAASLGGGPSVGKAKATREIATPYDTPEPARAPVTRDDMFAQIERDTAGADPYAAPQNDSPFGVRVPKGYARSRHGQEGAMFGPKPVGPAHDSKQYDRDIMLSDAHAKQEAYALGRAHQWQQGKEGKPVEWAYDRPDDIAERGEMSGDRGRAKPAGGKAAGATVARAERKALPEERPVRDAVTAVANGAQRGFDAAVDSKIVDEAAKGIAAAPPDRQMATFQRHYVPTQPPQPLALSDERSKDGAGKPGSMAQANRSMAASSYEYKPQYAGEAGQKPGEKNVGPMAQNMAADPVASTAIVKRPDGMLAIDKDKYTKLLGGGLADLQLQVDSMQRKQASR